MHEKLNQSNKSPKSLKWFVEYFEDPPPPLKRESKKFCLFLSKRCCHYNYCFKELKSHTDAEQCFNNILAYDFRHGEGDSNKEQH